MPSSGLFQRKPVKRPPDTGDGQDMISSLGTSRWGVHTLPSGGVLPSAENTENQLRGCPPGAQPAGKGRAAGRTGQGTGRRPQLQRHEPGSPALWGSHAALEESSGLGALLSGQLSLLALCLTGTLLACLVPRVPLGAEATWYSRQGSMPSMRSPWVTIAHLYLDKLPPRWHISVKIMN